MQTPRIVGIDAARGFAILGMFVAHAIPRADESELLVDGRSSVLFATLAGLSLGLMCRSTLARVALTMSVAQRGLFLCVLGGALSLLPSEVAVILDYYGIMFLLLLPVLFAPRSVLAALTVALAVAMPVLAESWQNTEVSGWARFAGEYLLTGHYPALVWLPFLLVGLICAKSDVTSPRTQRWMFGGGLSMSAIGYGAAWLVPGVSTEAHSGSTAEMVGTGGFALAVIGTLLLLTQRSGVTRTLLAPVSAAGAMPLTVYTLQILVLSAASALRGAGGWVPEYPGWPLLLGMTTSSLIVASLWHRYIGAGPLEHLLRWMTGPRIRLSASKTAN